MPTPLLPQSVYVPVPIENELPEKSGWYNCYAGDEFLGQDYFYDGKFSHKPVTHWLKPKEGYFLSKEELEGLLGEAFDAGEVFNHQEFLYMERGIKREAPDKSSYIKQLLP